MLLGIINRILCLALLAGSTLCLLFVVFSGSVTNFPFNEFYWLQADTSSIKAADGDITRWTFWGLCHPESYDASKNGKCPSLGPDEPLSPYDNFGNSTNLPTDFVKSRDTYYYLSRFAFPLLLIALIFSGVSFITHIMGPCWASMRHVTTFFISLGMFFVLAGAACQTAVVVLAKQKFSDANLKSKIGPSMMGMTWAAVACLLICFLLSCLRGMHKAYVIHRDFIATQKAEEMNQQEQLQQQQQQQPMTEMEPIPVAGSQSQLNAPLSTDGAKRVSTDNAGTDYQGALPSNEGGIRFFKIKRNHKPTDEESSL